MRDGSSRKNARTAREVARTSKIFHTPFKLHNPGEPCTTCFGLGHVFSQHKYLYSVVDGLTAHDRYRCTVGNCPCGLKYEQAQKRYNDLAAADTEAFHAEPIDL